MMTKEMSSINLYISQFQRLKNIVFLKGIISSLNKTKETYKDTNQYSRYDTLIFEENMRLTDLTGNLPPDNRLREMHRIV